MKRTTMTMRKMLVKASTTEARRVETEPAMLSTLTNFLKKELVSTPCAPDHLSMLAIISVSLF
jgi:hypothetical protein